MSGWKRGPAEPPAQRRSRPTRASPARHQSVTRVVPTPPARPFFDAARLGGMAPQDGLRLDPLDEQRELGLPLRAAYPCVKY